MQKKVMLVNSFSDGSSFWRVSCDCGDPGHDAILWFEQDPKFGFISLSVSTEVAFSAQDGFWKNISKRMKAAFQILFLGNYRETGEVILDKDGIDGMLFALTEGKRCLSAAREK